LTAAASFAETIPNNSQRLERLPSPEGVFAFCTSPLGKPIVVVTLAFMASTLDDEFRKTLRDFATGASGANEQYALTTIRVVAANIDGDTDVWTLTAAEAESRARKYRLAAAYALRGAAICDEHADDVRADPITMPSLTLSISG
jgi:hypothetical protein